jgi:hypothetical protein
MTREDGLEAVLPPEKETLMFLWITIAAAVLVGFLGWNLYRRFRSDRLGVFNEKRRNTSRMVGRGELVDGNRHLDVALALTQDTFFYENSDMQASIDLQWLREIEYDTELATGTAVAGGKVLRLRSQSQTFEFVLPNDAVAKWHLMLPPRRPQVATAT